MDSTLRDLERHPTLIPTLSRLWWRNELIRDGVNEGKDGLYKDDPVRELSEERILKDRVGDEVPFHWDLCTIDLDDTTTRLKVSCQ